MSHRFAVALAVAVAAVTSGCAPTVRTVAASDGRAAYSVTCDAESCLERAYATCPNGYTIVGNENLLYGGVLNGPRDMTFRCREGSNNPPVASR
jgi:hypothetical protein